MIAFNKRFSGKKALLIFLIVLSMLMQLFLQITHISATNYVDFSPYITDVSITDENGNSFDSYPSVDKDSMIKIKYDFHIDDIRELNYENNSFELTLPSELEILEEMSGKITASRNLSEADTSNVNSKDSLIESIKDSDGLKSMNAPELPEEIQNKVELSEPDNNSNVTVSESNEKEETTEPVKAEITQDQSMESEELLDEKISEEKIEDSKQEISAGNNINDQVSEVKDETEIDSKDSAKVEDETAIDSKDADKVEDEIKVEEIEVINEEEDISDGSIGTLTVTTQNKIIIKFNKNVINKPLNINGSFSITSCFNKEKISGGGKKIIQFEVSGAKKDIVINFTNENPSIDKSGVYDSKNNEILWTINVDTKGNSYSNLFIEDTIGDDQTLIDNGFTQEGSSSTCLIDEKLADSSMYLHNDGNFTYNFKEGFNGKAVIKLKTKPTKEIMTKTGDKVFKNDVALKDGISTLASDCAQVGVKIDPISKNGLYNKDNGLITWTIEINKSNMKMVKPIICDQLSHKRIEPTSDEEKEQIIHSIVLTKEGAGDNLADSLGQAVFVGDTLEYRFENNIDCYYKLTFDTPVKDDIELKLDYNVNNKATLKYGDISVDSNEKTVGITSPIKKIGEYKEDTNTIEWTIYLNEMSSDLKKVYVKDYIGEDHRYTNSGVHVYKWNSKGGYSAIGDEVKEKITYTSCGDDNESLINGKYKKTGELEIVFENEVKEPYIIKYSTEPTAEVFTTWKGMTGAYFYNWCDLFKEGSDKAIASSEFSFSKVMKIFEKQADGYNSEDNTITWKLIVNEPKAELKDASIYDPIPSDMEFVQDSIEVYKNDDYSAPISKDSSQWSGGYESDKNSVEIKFADTIKDKYIIKFKTKIIDFSKSTSSDQYYRNIASLHLPSGDISDYEDVKVTNNNFIIKTYEYSPSHPSTIKWKILIDFSSIKNYYPEDTKLEDVVITDNLKDMNLDKTIPITLYKGNEENTDNKVDWKYEDTNSQPIDSKNMVIHLPDLELESAYLLTFRADIENNNKSVQNSVNLKCKGYTGDADSGVIELKKQYLDVEGSGESNSVTIYKTDSNRKPLGDAEFGLYKEEAVEGTNNTSFKFLKNIFSDKVTGKAVFENLDYGSYIIKEINPPQGYNKVDDEYKFLINGDKDNFEYTFVNSKKSSSNHHHHHDDDDDDYGSIKIRKVDENNNVLKGAEFTLTDLKGFKIKSAVTNEYGIALFEEIPFGNYLIKETKGIDGYEMEGLPITSTISSKSQKSYTVVNKKSEDKKDDDIIIIPSDTKHLSSIKVVKKNENDEVLNGAVIGVYNENGMSLGSKTTDKDGIVVFDNLPFGRYSIKEINAPYGYILSDNKIDVSLDSNVMKSIDFINEKENKSITSEKIENKAPINDDKTISKNKISNNIDKAKTKIRSILPKSGSLFDTKVLAGFGIVILCIGLAIYIKKGCKGWK